MQLAGPYHAWLRARDASTYQDSGHNCLPDQDASLTLQKLLHAGVACNVAYNLPATGVIMGFAKQQHHSAQASWSAATMARTCKQPIRLIHGVTNYHHHHAQLFQAQQVADLHQHGHCVSARTICTRTMTLSLAQLRGWSLHVPWVDWLGAKASLLCTCAGALPCNENAWHVNHAPGTYELACFCLFNADVINHQTIFLTHAAKSLFQGCRSVSGMVIPGIGNPGARVDPKMQQQQPLKCPRRVDPKNATTTAPQMRSAHDKPKSMMKRLLCNLNMTEIIYAS